MSKKSEHEDDRQLCERFFDEVAGAHSAGRERSSCPSSETKCAISDLPPKEKVRQHIDAMAEQTRIVAEAERRLRVVKEQEAMMSTNLHRAHLSLAAHPPTGL